MAKEFGLNALHLEALGESCQWEIVVGGDILERLVEIQCQFKRLAVMGDDEYRGFYIEVSRPTPEEWGDAGELRIGLHSTHWRRGGSMSLRSDTGILGRFVLRTGSVPGSSSRTAPRVLMGNQMMRGAGRP